tara:strand:+ start:295 stop:507 length:213 start_codon:yes stop_codon:yes gene_type:complete
LLVIKKRIFIKERYKELLPKATELYLIFRKFSLKIELFRKAFKNLFIFINLFLKMSIKNKERKITVKNNK